MDERREVLGVARTQKREAAIGHDHERSMVEGPAHEAPLSWRGLARAVHPWIPEMCCRWDELEHDLFSARYAIALAVGIFV
jgi:hypothetical protein